MSISNFDTSRAEFEKIEKMYKEYMVLYRFFNRGKLKGVCSFADFYWMHQYYWKHRMRYL